MTEKNERLVIEQFVDRASDIWTRHPASVSWADTVFKFRGGGWQFTIGTSESALVVAETLYQAEDEAFPSFMERCESQLASLPSVEQFRKMEAQYALERLAEKTKHLGLGEEFRALMQAQAEMLGAPRLIDRSDEPEHGTIVIEV